MTEVRNLFNPTIERGGGTTVVFLHGYPLDHRMWERQLETLPATHRVVLLDLPGYGLARGELVPETLSGFADYVHRTLAGKFVQPVTVVGHSFGGYVALQLYRDHPEHLSALVLTNTRSDADTPAARANRLATVQRLEDPSERLDVDETARVLLAPATWVDGGAVRETVRSMIQDVPSTTIRATLRAIAKRPDMTPILSTIRVPSLVIWGEEDRLIPPAQSRSMVQWIPEGTGVGIPGAGHLPALETPELFGAALGDFLSRLLPP